MTLPRESPPSPGNTRTALVTGASRGIGRAIAVALGTRGFKVVINFLSNAQAAAQTVALVQQAGGSALAVQADVGRDGDRQRLVRESLAFLGRCDVLVNNAGIPPAKRDDLLEATEDIYDRVMDTNLKGPFFLTQLVARTMVAAGVGIGESRVESRESSIGTGSAMKGALAASGPYPESPVPNPRACSSPAAFANAESRIPIPALRCIININSLSAYAASVQRSQYCIAKAGMSMMTQLFAARLARDGINVYEIRPGIIDTDMARNAKEKYDKLIFEGDLLPQPRWGTGEDVARAVLAIVEGYLPYSTGAVIDVDGGYHIRRL